MTAKEAIKILSRRTTIPGDGYSFEEINEAIDMAIAAIEKRIPKKPVAHESTDITNTRYYDYSCPTCGKWVYKKLPFEERNREICPDCGQALCWEE